ncbi:MAG: hypothetical protein V4697_01265 [Patescibacteria group bacterium]
MKNAAKIRRLLDIREEKTSVAVVKLANLLDVLAEFGGEPRDFLIDILMDLLLQKSPPIKADLSGLPAQYVSRVVTSLALNFPESIADIFTVFEREVKIVGPRVQRGSDEAIVGTLCTLIGLEKEDYFVKKFTEDQHSRGEFEKQVLALLECAIRQGWFNHVSMTRESCGQLSNAVGCFVRNGKSLAEGPLRVTYRANHLIGLTQTFYRLNELGDLPAEKLNMLGCTLVDEVCHKVFFHAPRWARLKMLYGGLQTYSPQPSP